MSEAGYEPALERIGSDESGKGDYFGPLVVAACYVDARSEGALIEIGAADSKKLSDRRNLSLARKIRSICPCEVICIGPERYNELYRKMENLNKLLAWAHGKAIRNLLHAYPSCTQVVSDKFGPDSRLEAALEGIPEDVELVQVTRGERDPAVAAASILARAEFLRRLEMLSDQAGMKLPKGASQVLDAARALHSRGGMGIMRKFAKLHFKTTKKLG